MARRYKPLPPPEVYRRHLATSGCVGILLVIISLAFGMAGYAYFEKIGFYDAFNASMVLSGMGPVLNPASTGGKVFAGPYALYSGFAVLAIAAIMFAPVVRRFLHRFNLEGVDDDVPKKDPPAKWRALIRRSPRAAGAVPCYGRGAGPSASHTRANPTRPSPLPSTGTRE
jgi:hypothetical protein